jgi:hypothetical protein
VLEPTADGFRNYLRDGEKLSPETRLLDRANLMTLTAPEMTVLIGGMRALNANFGQSQHGIFTDRPETMTNDFFLSGEITAGVHVRLDGPPRAAMACCPDGTAFINLRDANGNVIWSAR